MRRVLHLGPAIELNFRVRAGRWHNYGVWTSPSTRDALLVNSGTSATWRGKHKFGNIRWHTRGPDKMRISSCQVRFRPLIIAPFGDAYEKIGTIQRRLAWPLHKDDTLFQSGIPTGLNIYFFHNYSTLLNTMSYCMFRISFLCRS